MKSRFQVSHLLLIFLLSLIFLAPVASGATPEPARKSLAVLPFSSSASQGLSHLEEGIRDMLASRLASETGLILVDKNRMESAVRDSGTSQALLELGKKLEADYLVTGNFTSQEGKIRLEAVVYEIGSSSPVPVQFLAAAETEEGVLEAVNQLRREITAAFFSIRPPVSTPSVTTSEIAPELDHAQDLQPALFQSAHPEKPFITPRNGS
jgi:TolB-like protein